MNEQVPAAEAQQGAPQLQVQMPEQHFEVLYSDMAFVSFTPMGFVLDFAQHTPQMNLARIVARIGMSPVHLKILSQVLAQNLQGYEERFGEIALHPAMHEQQRHIGFQTPKAEAKS